MLTALPIESRQKTPLCQGGRIDGQFSVLIRTANAYFNVDRETKEGHSETHLCALLSMFI